MAVHILCKPLILSQEGDRIIHKGTPWKFIFNKHSHAWGNDLASCMVACPRHECLHIYIIFSFGRGKNACPRHEWVFDYIRITRMLRHLRYVNANA